MFLSVMPRLKFKLGTDYCLGLSTTEQSSEDENFLEGSSSESMESERSRVSSTDSSDLRRGIRDLLCSFSVHICISTGAFNGFVYSEKLWEQTIPKSFRRCSKLPFEGSQRL